ncbi:ATP synthase delta chain [hydrothermal vent metagenome]|uniref:ATP synthase delta chain n=1 Tax=hydrothermal vent metagenome TaxID=652676 RepID=A0A3B0RTW8_9ZZZZ
MAQKSKFSPLVANFIGVICQNGRAMELIEIVDAFLAKVAAAKGVIHASATTAQALSSKQKTNLAAGLKKTLGRPVQLETEVDSRLLGGLIVQVGSRMFDSSLQTQLEGLKLAMKES